MYFRKVYKHFNNHHSSLNRKISNEHAHTGIQEEEEESKSHGDDEQSSELFFMKEININTDILL